MRMCRPAIDLDLVGAVRAVLYLLGRQRVLALVAVVHPIPEGVHVSSAIGLQGGSVVLEGSQMSPGPCSGSGR